MHEVIVNPDGVSIRLITPDGTVLACVNAFHHDTYTTVDVISPPRGRHDVKALVFDFSAGTNQAPEYGVNPSKTHHSLSAPMGLVAVLVKPKPAAEPTDTQPEAAELLNAKGVTIPGADHPGFARDATNPI